MCIRDRPGTVPVAIFTARAVALGELYGRMEQGYRRLSVKQRDHYGSSYGTVHIRQLPGGVSAGTAPIPVSYTHLDVYKRQGLKTVYVNISTTCCLLLF